MEHESDVDTNCNLRDMYDYQRIGRGTGDLGKKRTSENHLNYSNVKIIKNTEKSPWNSSRPTITQTPEKKPSANAGVKTRKGVR